MGSWHDGKLFVERTVAINHDALHVIVGMLVWIAAGLVTRRPLISIRPWLWVLAVIGWNEAVDLWVERWPDPATQYGEGAKDLLLTMFVPTVLLLALRFAPSLFKTGRSAKR
jgi:hypothetical protein